jgi:hypothetical protein
VRWGWWRGRGRKRWEREEGRGKGRARVGEKVLACIVCRRFGMISACAYVYV